MIGKLVKKLMEELEVPVEIDPADEEISIQVNEEQAVEFMPRGDRGYILRTRIGKAGDQDMEELYIDTMVNSLYNEEEGGFVVSINADDRAFITFSRDEELGYQQFADDFEEFLNRLEFWTKRWKGTL